MTSKVEERLEKSLDNYTEQLERACGYLVNKTPYYQIRRLKL